MINNQNSYSVKYFAIFLILVSFSVIAFAEPVPEHEPQYNSTANENCGPETTLQDGMCVVEKSQNVTVISSGIWGGIMEYPAHHINIENINGTFYYMSEPFELNSNLPNISFHDVLFTSPYTTTPPRYIYSDVTFFDETEETLRVIFTQPDFTEHKKPQAGFIAKSDGYHFLVSVNLEELSPLKQFKSGISVDHILCDDSLVLIQKYDHSPACVKPETKTKLIERGWTNFISIQTDIGKTGIYHLNVDERMFDIEYSITGAYLNSIHKDNDNILNISVNMSHKGTLSMSIPPDLIVDPSKDWDGTYVILVNGLEVAYEITGENNLDIPLSMDATLVQILVTYPISG